ncbi:hypothetical protein BJ508DRAFT_312834 [Ascobolus immersus RN42]|uniref:Uncharacterized protein n=1 Tax=Ascobolus immersus RN42 TaxID=1160509 RepID=A0A3N4HNE3_ASCIM|nr:hypothetical protein BJ508DRAFT_312834 [Ascobolus immersus RN42]
MNPPNARDVELASFAPPSAYPNEKTSASHQPRRSFSSTISGNTFVDEPASFTPRPNPGYPTTYTHPLTAEERAAKLREHYRRKKQCCICGWSCLAAIAVIIAVALIISRVVSQKHKGDRSATVYEAMAQCAPSTAYSELFNNAKAPSKDLQKQVNAQKIRNENGKFKPMYSNQCEYHLPNYTHPKASLPYSEDGKAAESAPGPFQILLPANFNKSTPLSQDFIDRLDVLDKNKYIPLHTYPIPPPLHPFLLSPEYKDGKMACLTSALAIDNPGKKKHKEAWEKLKREIEGYKNDAVRVMPADGFVWKSEVKRLGAEKKKGDPPQEPVESWYCWLRSME